jgi:hypothetical protein
MPVPPLRERLARLARALHGFRPAPGCVSAARPVRPPPMRRRDRAGAQRVPERPGAVLGRAERGATVRARGAPEPGHAPPRRGWPRHGRHAARGRRHALRGGHDARAGEHHAQWRRKPARIRVRVPSTPYTGPRRVHYGRACAVRRRTRGPRLGRGARGRQLDTRRGRAPAPALLRRRGRAGASARPARRVPGRARAGDRRVR